MDADQLINQDRWDWNWSGEKIKTGREKDEDVDEERRDIDESKREICMRNNRIKRDDRNQWEEKGNKIEKYTEIYM